MTGLQPSFVRLARRAAYKKQAHPGEALPHLLYVGGLAGIGQHVDLHVLTRAS